MSDLATVGDRWPEYIDASHRLGATGVAGIPMRLATSPSGALNLYTTAQRPWRDEDLSAARVLADVATSHLVNASKVRQLEQLTEQLQHALGARVVIEQAKGIIASRNDVSVDEATTGSAAAPAATTPLSAPSRRRLSPSGCKV